MINQYPYHLAAKALEELFDLSLQVKRWEDIDERARIPRTIVKTLRKYIAWAKQDAGVDDRDFPPIIFVEAYPLEFFEDVAAAAAVVAAKPTSKRKRVDECDDDGDGGSGSGGGGGSDDVESGEGEKTQLPGSKRQRTESHGVGSDRDDEDADMLSNNGEIELSQAEQEQAAFVQEKLVRLVEGMNLPSEPEDVAIKKEQIEDVQMAEAGEEGEEGEGEEEEEGGGEEAEEEAEDGEEAEDEEDQEEEEEEDAEDAEDEVEVAEEGEEMEEDGEADAGDGDDKKSEPRRAPRDTSTMTRPVAQDIERKLCRLAERHRRVYRGEEGTCDDNDGDDKARGARPKPKPKPPVLYAFAVIEHIVLLVSLDSASEESPLVVLDTVTFDQMDQWLWNALSIALPVNMARDEMHRRRDFWPRRPKLPEDTTDD